MGIPSAKIKETRELIAAAVNAADKIPLSKFPLSKIHDQNDVKGYHRCDVILLRTEVEG